MTFKKKVGGTFPFPATVRFPSEDGVWEDNTLTLIFKRISVSEQEALATDQDVLMAVIVGWTDYVDENGKPVLYSRKELQDLLDIQEVRMGFRHAYTEALSKARPGN